MAGEARTLEHEVRGAQVAKWPPETPCAKRRRAQKVPVVRSYLAAGGGDQIIL